MPKKNELKSRVKTELLKTYAEDTVRKGMARGERWIKAAYGVCGVQGYQYRLDESGDFEGLVSFFGIYCAEVLETPSRGDRTMNNTTFGIYKR